MHLHRPLDPSLTRVALQFADMGLLAPLLQSVRLEELLNHLLAFVVLKPTDILSCSCLATFFRSYNETMMIA